MASYPSVPHSRERHSSSSWSLRLRAAWATVRRWLRPPRRLHVTRGGGFFIVGAFLIGFAAINTGDNLLYLLLGGMMGFIAVSGWMSEQVVRGIRVTVRPASAATAERPVRIVYEIENMKRWMPSYGLEVVEPVSGARAFLAGVKPAQTRTARVDRTFQRRGVYRLDGVVLSTSFPFGLFVKERDLDVGGEVLVRPRTDRPVREPAMSGRGVRERGWLGGRGASARGEYRGLREYRPGDDPRDVHWRSSARLGEPLVREYDQDDAETSWICLDLSAEPGEAAEAAVERAAALLARARQRGERFALCTSDRRVGPGTGPAQLERVLDALARAEVRPGAPPPAPPVDRRRCVLVTAGRQGEGYGDVITGAA